MNKLVDILEEVKNKVPFQIVLRKDFNRITNIKQAPHFMIRCLFYVLSDNKVV